MSWRSHGKSNEDLVRVLRKNQIIEHDDVANAMAVVDRADFVPQGHAAYEDRPQPIGYGATISAPHMYAHDGRCRQQR